MPVLSLDTTTTVASVAIVRGEAVLSEISLGMVQNHAARLMPLVDVALREAGVTLAALTQLAVSAGPGSFTGLRIGLSLAKGIAEGLAVPLVLISTLEVLAAQCSLHSGVVIPLLDAQRQAYYASAFRVEGGHCVRLSPDMVVQKGEFATWALSFAPRALLTGEAAIDVEAGPHFAVAPNFFRAPRASVLGFLSQGRPLSDPRFALPNYIRPSSAQPKKGV
ncbi:MAG: tRNA (adenosine(37)-N6)-threonylcarbamoyltransferase complex dimerization subunit type 1 TsaB [Peptococcaceae bacterium]|nr:tRNA (adenosine(37)-N6)-threonylcarbamoyltransferase complex dimerization subunit type 1 TsaB [Peptococcaceae bacterium]